MISTSNTMSSIFIDFLIRAVPGLGETNSNNFGPSPLHSSFYVIVLVCLIVKRFNFFLVLHAHVISQWMDNDKKSCLRATTNQNKHKNLPNVSIIHQLEPPWQRIMKNGDLSSKIWLIVVLSVKPLFMWSHKMAKFNQQFPISKAVIVPSD